VVALAVIVALAGIVYLERAPYERQTRKPAPATD
jgi:hypothetical protein